MSGRGFEIKGLLQWMAYRVPVLVAIALVALLTMGVPSALADPGVGTISTVVGIGPASEGDGGPATDGRMSHPERIAFDAAGNLYIAERGNHRVRKVDTGGVITTVAGNGDRNFCGDGGQATNACLDTPTGVAVDDANNVLYIADSENRRVRAVDLSTGVISTAAGNGGCCFPGDGGLATNAEFHLPTDVAVDTSSNLYIADRFGRRVHMVDALTGIINTVAGTGECCDFRGDGGPAIDAWLEQPWGIEIDANDDLYIADRWNHRVRMVDTSTGIIDTVAGSGNGGFCGDGGLATDACLNQPTDVAFDSGGNMYIAAGNLIRRVDSGTGIITTVAGIGPGSAGDGGLATDADFRGARGIAVNASDDLFIADRFNHRIRRVDSPTQIITLFAGSFPPGFDGDGGQAADALLNSPFGIFADGSGNLFIADNENDRVRRVDAATGDITTVAGNGNEGFCGDGDLAINACVFEPHDVVVDSSGNLYIAEQGNQRVRKVDAVTGIITTFAGNGTRDFCGDGGLATAACFNNPRFLAIDAQDNVYVTDRDNRRIRKIDATTGIITTVAGNGDGGFCGDGGQAINACFSAPWGITVDDFGNLLIADIWNHRVRMVDTGGIITTVAGNGDCCVDGDGGPATSAVLGNPSDVEVDSGGNMFISSFERQRVRRVDGASGIITTVAGSGPEEEVDGGYSGDGGPATNALLGGPFGVAVTPSGDLLFADYVNHVIRMVEGVAATPDADLSVTQADSPDPVIVGETVVYNITVSNNGPSIVADAVLTNTLSEASASILSATSQSTQVICTPDGDAVICDLGRMNVSEQATVVLLVKPQSSGTFTNTASVTAGREDLDLTNNTSVEETTVELDECQRPAL